MNKQAIAVVGGVATAGIAYGGTPRSIGGFIAGKSPKTGRSVKSGVRSIGLRIAKVTRAKLIARGQRQAAKQVIKNGNMFLKAADSFKKAGAIGRAARVGVAGVAIAETGMAAYCSASCGLDKSG